MSKPVQNQRPHQPVFTPKELRHIAQGCSRSELPWVAESDCGMYPEGVPSSGLLEYATLSG